MSDLQLSLLALGAVIIAGVILFNWWQERRFIQDSIRRFEAPADDALMEEFHIDTGNIAGLESEAIVIEEQEEVYDIAEDATLEELHREDDDDSFRVADIVPQVAPDAYPDLREPAAQAMEVAPPDMAPESLENDESHHVERHAAMPVAFDDQVDLIGVMAFEAPLDIAAFAEAAQQLPKFDKPVRWALGNAAGEWCMWTPDLRPDNYIHAACALQLADRSGPVSQGTLLAFQEQLADMASRLGATLEWRGSDHPMEYAADLDQFCVGVDVMVGFHILQGSNGSFAGTKLRGLAEAGGMKLQEDGAFHYCNAHGTTLFSLVSQDQRPFKPETLRTVFYRGVSFQLDVPKVENCVEAFNQMVLSARQLASSLDGILVDDNQRALGDAEIDKIRQQLKMIYSRMLARGITPGSLTAQRLFS